MKSTTTPDRDVGSSDSSASDTPRTDRWEYEQECNYDVPWEDHCRELERENARKRGEVAQLKKNCTQLYDAMKKVEAEAKFFQTLVQSHRSLSSPNTKISNAGTNT